MKKICSCILLSLFFIFFGCSKKQEQITEQQPVEEIPEVETFVFSHGDTFNDLLHQSKLSSAEILEILASLKKLMNINNCMPNDSYEVTYSTIVTSWQNFKYFPSTGMFFYELTKSTDNVIDAQKIHLETEKNTYEISGTIESSLWNSMISKNISPNIIIAFANMFAWQIDFLTDTRQGDKFKIIYETEILTKTQNVISTKILAGQYKTASNTFNAIIFTDSKGYETYFDENGKSIKSSFLKAPLQFKRISSYFTKARFHPILKYYRPHEGIDYAAPTGTPVSTIGDGVVIKSQKSGGYGNLVIIKHPNGYSTYYGHLSKYGRGIRKGVRVKQGQVIGYVGATGLATGPHLDFRIQLNGKFLNFLKLKTPPNITLKGQDKVKFDEYKTELLQKLNSF